MMWLSICFEQIDAMQKGAKECHYINSPIAFVFFIPMFYNIVDAFAETNTSISNLVLSING